jgi:hypothetical protein
MIRKHIVNYTVMALALAGCGSGDGDGGPVGPDDDNGNPTGPMAATIDGTRWVSDLAPSGLVVGTPGQFAITGQKLISSTNAQFVSLVLSNIDRPGTYPLGVSTTLWGGFGLFGDATSSWATPLSGAAGSVTITVLTETRIAGTFAFDATPAGGSASGTKRITEGTFDYLVERQTVGELPAHAGGRFTMQRDGVLWGGATSVAVDQTGTTPLLALQAGNDGGTIAFTLTEVTGPGTYELHNLSPRITIMVVDTNTGHMWGGSVTFDKGGSATTDDEGSITITEYTPARVKGTFGGTLMPSPGSAATTPIVLADGVCDLGLTP